MSTIGMQKTGNLNIRVDEYSLLLLLFLMSVFVMSFLTVNNDSLTI